MSFFKYHIPMKDKTIGGESIYIIAEMAIAHDGKMDKAFRLIDSAYEANADAIQFELFDPDDNTVPDCDMYQLLKSVYFTKEQWQELFEYAREKNLDIFSFAYDQSSLKLALQLKTDGIKLNSSDLMNSDMLKTCATSGLPFTVGTGGSTFEEIAEALDYIKQHGGRSCILMQGVQNFPTKLEYARINRIRFLRNSFDIQVGYADHTDAETDLSKIIDLVAVGMGVRILEKHITLDRSEKGIDYQSALEPDEFKQYIKRIREVEATLGDSKLMPLLDVDREYRRFQKKSIVASTDLKKGTLLRKEHVRFLRTMQDDEGIAPLHFYKIEGKTLTKNIPAYTPITLDSCE